MDPRYIYRIWLDGVRVYANYENSVSKKYDRGERVFHRETISGVLTFQRQDWTKFYYQDLDHKFTVLIQRGDPETDLYEDYITATFTKIDCDWNYDDQVVKVNVTVIDRYEKILAGLEREFDLIGELKPEISTVVYKKQPMLQIAFPYHGVLYNLIGDTSFILQIPEYTETDLSGFKFEQLTTKLIFIAGTGDLSVDVSGVYVQTFGSPNYVYERSDGLYKIQRISLTRYGIIEVSGSTLRYQMPDLQDFTINVEPFGEHNVFTSVANSDQVNAFPLDAFQRMLTDSPLPAGVASLPLPQPDIADLVFGYKYYVDPNDYPFLFATVFPDDDHTTSPTPYGKFSSTALHFAGQYFDFLTQYPSPNEEFKRYPLLQKSWQEHMLGVSRFGVSSYTSLLETASVDVTNKNMYEIGEVLKVIIPLLDPLISFDTTSVHSQFLYDTDNPVSGVTNLRHFITAKSNVVVGDYDNADTKELITFNSIMEELLRFNPKLFWWISADYKFHVEHIKYYNNGRSYTTQIISNDLTTQIEPKTNKAWAYHTKAWGYRKEILPERQVNKWMDNVSDPFNGYPIEFISNFVQKGNIDTQTTSRFTSDLDYIQALSSLVSRDGFCIVSAELVDDVWTVPFTEVPQGNGVTFFIQNGFWSNLYLHKNFHRYNLPSRVIRLNNVNTVALTTKRAREQKISIAGPIEPDMMELITTSIGTAEVDNAVVIMSSRQENYTLLHDMDFLNPCPCGGSYKEASWVMYIGTTVEEDADLSEVVISSFLIDGIEYLTDPVPIGGAATIVNIGGFDWCTNLADTINSLAIGGISAPYPIAADFANGMNQVNNFLRVKMPTCMDITITVERPIATGWSFQIVQDGHNVNAIDYPNFSNADPLAPNYAFIWDEQPRIVESVTPCT